jgi:hypothetical protein
MVVNAYFGNWCSIGYLTKLVIAINIGWKKAVTFPMPFTVEEKLPP